MIGYLLYDIVVMEKEGLIVYYDFDFDCFMFCLNFMEIDFGKIW